MGSTCGVTGWRVMPLTTKTKCAAFHVSEYKIKQIPKMDILYSRYSRKNKKTTESVIFRLYSKDIVKPIDVFGLTIVFGIKTKYQRLRCFPVFFLNIENARCSFSEFVLFCIF